MTPQYLCSLARRWFSSRNDAIEVPIHLNDRLRPYQVNHPSEFTSERALRYYERAVWSGAPDDIRRFAYRFYMLSRKAGLPLYVHTCWRSSQLQRTLYEQERSTVLSGAHQRSCAIDMVHQHFHWELPFEVWRFIGDLGKTAAKREGVKINWGGDWKSFYDPAHFELQGWNTFSEVDGHANDRLTIGKLKP